MGTSGLGALAAQVAGAVDAGLAPWFDPAAGETVLMPEARGAGYWVGAPSVVADDHRGRVLLAYRRRRPRDGSANERGYMAAIAESVDGGKTFADIWTVAKQQIGTSSIERACLRPSATGWSLYTSWEDPPASGRWRIDLMRAAEPEAFSLSSAVPVMLPDNVGVDAVKDPYVFEDNGEQLMYISTFLTPRGPAPTSLAVSTDGVHFAWQGETLGRGISWDAYQARISSILWTGSGFVAYYDGGASVAEDTEERCGLAVSTDLRTWQSLSLDRPALVSPHATGSLRYVEVVRIETSTWAYYEYARPDGSHELRRNLLTA